MPSIKASSTPYTDTTQTKKHKANHTKRPMNAFMVYSQQRRQDIAASSVKINHSMLSKKFGAEWKSLSSKEKEPFIEKANYLKHLHAVEFPDYKYKPKKRNPSGSTRVKNGGVSKVSSSSGSRKTASTGRKEKRLSASSKCLDLDQYCLPISPASSDGSRDSCSISVMGSPVSDVASRESPVFKLTDSPPASVIRNNSSNNSSPVNAVNRESHFVPVNSSISRRESPLYSIVHSQGVPVVCKVITNEYSAEGCQRVVPNTALRALVYLNPASRPNQEIPSAAITPPASPTEDLGNSGPVNFQSGCIFSSGVNQVHESAEGDDYAASNVSEKVENEVFDRSLLDAISGQQISFLNSGVNDSELNSNENASALENTKYFAHNNVSSIQCRVKNEDIELVSSDYRYGSMISQQMPTNLDNTVQKGSSDAVNIQCKTETDIFDSPFDTSSYYGDDSQNLDIKCEMDGMESSEFISNEINFSSDALNDTLLNSSFNDLEDVLLFNKTGNFLEDISIENYLNSSVL